ncbi:MAG TPA: F0F1 ATP synthase subunit delta [Steroidobacteraceae bacterium]|jgi:F-type H+-transporting ATPase subunit delta
MAADKATVSRPYAKAAFAEARAPDRLTEWSQGLAAAAAVVRDPRVEQLLDNPEVAPHDLAQLILDVSGERLGEPGRNFIFTLAENRRLALLPEIAVLFDELKDEAEGVADVVITSAAPLDEAHRRKLAVALERRLKRRVRLHCEIDSGLIGGAVLRSGDLVIDGSLRSKLERLTYELTE